MLLARKRDAMPDTATPDNPSPAIDFFTGTNPPITPTVVESVDVTRYDPSLNKGSSNENAVSVTEDGRVVIVSPFNWRIRLARNQEGLGSITLGREIAGYIPRHLDVPVLCNVEGEWFVYTGSAWRPERKHEVFDLVRNAIADVGLPYLDDNQKPQFKALNPGAAKVNDVMNVGLAPDARMDVPEQNPDERVVYLANGSLHIREDGTRKLTPSTPSVFNLAALPFDYEPDAVCPQWLAFLAETFAHDPKAIDALQEWFGYILVGRPGWMQKMFWLIGPRRSGKGVILGIAQAMMGEAATATSLHAIAQDFGMENVIGKNLAIIDDARDPDARVAHKLVERLLTLTSGGFMSIQRKHQKAWDGRPTAVVFGASNVVPRLPDAGSAISSRLEVIRTKQSHFGKEDRTLGARLERELPGILNWSLKGLERLQEQGRFTQSNTMADVIEQVDRGATGATPMVRDHLMVADGGLGISPASLKDLAAWWSTQQEDDYKPNAPAMKSAITAEFPDVATRQRAKSPWGEPIPSGYRGVVARCRECDNPAARISLSFGPECNIHLTTDMFKR